LRVVFCHLVESSDPDKNVGKCLTPTLSGPEDILTIGGNGMRATKAGKTFREQPNWTLNKFDGVPMKLFCDACEVDTIALNTGNLVTVNLIGKTWGLRKFKRCATCGSVERNMWFIIGIPIIPLGRWRVKYLARNKWVARKMMKSSFPDFAKQHDTSKRNPVLIPLLLLLLIVLVVGVGGVIVLDPSH